MSFIANFLLITVRDFNAQSRSYNKVPIPQQVTYLSLEKKSRENQWRAHLQAEG